MEKYFDIAINLINVWQNKKVPSFISCIVCICIQGYYLLLSSLFVYLFWPNLAIDIKFDPLLLDRLTWNLVHLSILLSRPCQSRDEKIQHNLLRIVTKSLQSSGLWLIQYIELFFCTILENPINFEHLHFENIFVLKLKETQIFMCF